jgi:hypothetical protein
MAAILSALLISQTEPGYGRRRGEPASPTPSPDWGTADIVAQRGAASREERRGRPRSSIETMSPLAHLGRARTPALIFHGEKDAGVPLGQSQESYRRLRRSGLNVQMIIYPEQGHAIEVPSYQIDKIRREYEWIVGISAGLIDRRKWGVSERNGEPKFHNPRVRPFRNRKAVDSAGRQPECWKVVIFGYLTGKVRYGIELSRDDRRGLEGDDAAWWKDL